MSSDLIFLEVEPQNHDVCMDISIWNIKNKSEAVEFKDVPSGGITFKGRAVDDLCELLNSGCVCIMCSLNGHRHTVACTIFTAKHLVKRIKAGKPLLIRHPVNQMCACVLNISTSTRLPNPEDDTGTLEMIQKCTNISQDLTSDVAEKASEMADSMGYAEAFFPAASAGRGFQNLLTVMPCTIMQPDLEDLVSNRGVLRSPAKAIKFPMPLLQVLLQHECSAVPFEWLAYNVYGACLLMNVDPKDMANATSLSSTNVHWAEFMESLITLTTCDPRFNEYFSDEAPVRIKEMLSVQNRKVEVFELEGTESIQRPLSKVKTAPDDCEDWAMLLKMMALSIMHYARSMRKQNLMLDSLQVCPLLCQLSEPSQLGIIAIIKHLAQLLEEKSIQVSMACGIAGAPSLSSKSAGGAPGGHEFCMLWANKMQPGETRFYAAVLEGTNWTKTTHLPHETVQKLNQNCHQVAAEYSLDGRFVRSRGMQHVGDEAASVYESFWRTIVGLGEHVLVSIRQKDHPKAGGVVQWGANLGRLLRFFETGTENKSVDMKRIGEQLGSAALEQYTRDMQSIFEMANLPKIRHNDFSTQIANKWHPALDFDKLPAAFLQRNKQHHNFFFHPHQSTQPRGVGFMSGYLYYAGL